MGAKTWGEIYLPEQRGPFVVSTLAALQKLLHRVQGLDLASIRLAEKKKVTRSSGHKAWRSLWVETDGVVLNYQWGFKGRHCSRRVVTDSEIPDMLEFYQVGLGDIEKLLGQIDTMIALRRLMATPEAQQLLRPLAIRVERTGGLSTYTWLQLSTSGLEYRLAKSSFQKPDVVYSSPDDVTLEVIQKHYIKLDEVKKAFAKITT